MPSHEQAISSDNGVQRARIETGRPPPRLPGAPAPAVDRPQPKRERCAGPFRRVARSSADAGRIKRGTSVYIKHALVHPWHVVVLAGATVFGVANWSLLVLLLVFAGAEIVLLGAILRLRAFRRYVDERLDQIDRAHAAEQRATLLLQMGDDHRRELLRLESIVDRIRDATSPHGTAAQIAVDECLHLLASYVRLAIAHNVSRECLASVNRHALEDEIRSLEAARFAQGPHARALAQRRMAIARKRADRWDRSREALDSIGQQLAMIGELVQLTHEQVAAPADPSGAIGEIDRVVDELDDSRGALDEVAELLGVEEAIDPLVLDMGRALRG
ncbi:MAG: hypothetical protein ACREJ3_17360 [Polyangiaceae bacterium]